MTNADLRAAAAQALAAALRSGDAGEIASARLFVRIVDAWVEARTEALAAVQGDGAPADTGGLDSALAAVHRAMGAPLGAALSSDLLDIVDDAYAQARDAVAARIAFGVVDERAVAWLHHTSTYYVGTMYDRTLSDAVRKAGEAVLRANVGRAEAGRMFAEALTDITGKRSLAYWEGLSVVTVGRAQEFGRIEGYDRIGAPEAIIDAVRDDRTSCVCRYLDGKRLPVATLVAQRDALVAATDPEAVRTVAPWPSCEGVAQRYAEGLIGAPPYHMACRTRTRLPLDTDPA